MDPQNTQLLIKALCSGIGVLGLMNAGLLTLLIRRRSSDGGITRKEHAELDKRVTMLEAHYETIKDGQRDIKEDVKELLRIGRSE